MTQMKNSNKSSLHVQRKRVGFCRKANLKKIRTSIFTSSYFLLFIQERNVFTQVFQMEQTNGPDLLKSLNAAAMFYKLFRGFWRSGISEYRIFIRLAIFVPKANRAPCSSLNRLKMKKLSFLENLKMKFPTWNCNCSVWSKEKYNISWSDI